MGAVNSQFGHDVSGTEATLLTAGNLTNADAGCVFFATDTKQLWVCQGSGVWQTVGSAGGVVPGAAGAVRSVMKIAAALTDATFSTIANVTVPNAIMGGGIRVLATGILGDGDSASTAQYHASISRVAGAATGITFGSAVGAATNNGVSGNAALAIQNGTITGAVGATQTVPIQMKVTKSAGSSANHVLVATLELLNGFGSGMTIAAA